MRVASLVAPDRMRVEEVEPPRPGPRQVRIRVHGCGVCGSNLPVWRGQPWFTYPLPPGAPGHEPWGVVDEVGPGCEEIAQGTPVAFLSDRAFAEHAIAPVDQVAPLPPALAGAPVPGEALACAVSVVARSRVQAGEKIAVVGVGFLGALVVSLARAAGAEVHAWSRRPFALQVARSAGAVRALPLDGPLDGHETFDCAIEAAGEQRTLDVAATLVRERGRLVIAGYHQEGPRVVNMQSWNWRGLDVINAHERDPAVYVASMRRAIELVARGVVDPRPLYTHVFPLDEIDHAFRVADERPPGFVKALVTA